MTEKELFNAIHQCNDEYLTEALEEGSSEKILSAAKKRHISIIKAAAAIAICILALDIGVTVMAAKSDIFRTWLFQMFGEGNVTEINSSKESPLPSDDNMTPEKPDEDKSLAIRENTMILGENESFICEYHMQDDAKIVDTVYSVENNDLSELPILSFQGNYDGFSFSFQYAIIQNEICAFNYTGDIDMVFHYADGDTAYAALYDGDGETDRECVAQLHLKNQEINKITGDDALCNFLMSPNGKTILCNYRADGYWTVLDLASRSEKRVDGINGYSHASEIEFVDDYQILTLGEPFTIKNTEWYSTYLIDLRTQKILNEFKDNGEISMRWSYSYKNGTLKIYDITGGDSFTVEHVKEKLHPVDKKGCYVLFGNLENENAPFYLVDLNHHSSMKIKLPAKLHSDVEIHLAANAKKLLFTNDMEAYLVDIRNL